VPGTGGTVLVIKRCGGEWMYCYFDKWIRPAFVAMLVCGVGATAPAQVTTTVLRNFEDNTVGGATNLTNANSSISVVAADNSVAVSNVSEGGSRRLRLDNPDAASVPTNGCVLTIPNAISGPGNWLVTAEVKVVNATTGGTNMIDSFGMAVRAGGTTTAKIPDSNAGYVMNLYDNAATAANLGYQTIGGAVQNTGAGSSDLTIYFGTDPSKSDDLGVPSGERLPTNDGNNNGRHRSAINSWGSSSNYVLIDNIKITGPGNFGEDRVFWCSVFDNVYTQSALENMLVQAKNNNFNTFVIQARYRADRSYRKNRDFATYSNNEVAFKASVDSTFDPVQYAIDRGRELGLRVYAAWSLFLVTDASGSLPGYIPSNTVTWVYNGGSPRVQVNADSEGLWMDPGMAASRAYNLQIVMDFLQNYDVDGIIFDRIRYASNTFGYNPTALTEMQIAGTPAPTDANFIAKRQQAVTTFLKEAYTAATNMKPWMVVGTVPIAFGDDLGETYNRVFQAWWQWSSAASVNRSISFGVCDLIMPQYYRQWDTGSGLAGPAANQRLMLKAAFGDPVAKSSAPGDMGLMPGANMVVDPLFYFITPTSDATDANNTAAQIAQNACDTRGNPANLSSPVITYPLNGWGIYSADAIVATEHSATNISRLHAANTSHCGTDVLASAAPVSDFLMKAGYDKTAPNPVTGASAVGGFRQATLTWNTPAAAADGETPSRYLIYRAASSGLKPFYANQIAKTTTVTGNSFTDNGAAAGTYYYLIVPVDDYNNKGTGVQVGPVVVQGLDIYVQSRLTVAQGSGKTPAPTYEDNFTGTQNTSTKSTAVPSAIRGDGSRFTGTVGQTATFRPNITQSGYYNIYITAGLPGDNVEATASYVATNQSSDRTGSVVIKTKVASPTPGLTNAWLLLQSNVPMPLGQAKGITFTNVNGNNSTGFRFVMDAVRYELITPDPLGSGVGDWTMY